MSAACQPGTGTTYLRPWIIKSAGEPVLRAHFHGRPDVGQFCGARANSPGDRSSTSRGSRLTRIRSAANRDLRAGTYQSTARPWGGRSPMRSDAGADGGLAGSVAPRLHVGCARRRNRGGRLRRGDGGRPAGRPAFIVQRRRIGLSEGHERGEVEPAAVRGDERAEEDARRPVVAQHLACTRLGRKALVVRARRRSRRRWRRRGRACRRSCRPGPKSRPVGLRESAAARRDEGAEEGPGVRPGRAPRNAGRPRGKHGAAGEVAAGT